MNDTVSQPDVWLTLQQAARKLGVHPSTLRRWADQGAVPVMRTPGGHRRFSASDIARFVDERRRLRVVASLEQIWAEQALVQTRRELNSHRDEAWLAAFDEQDREQKRLMGRRLMGLMLQYVSLGDGGEDILHEARAIGHAHAENALHLGLPLTDALQATMFFRDAVVDAAMHLPETANVRPDANVRLLRRINTLINAVQLAIAETYDQGRR